MNRRSMMQQMLATAAATALPTGAAGAGASFQPSWSSLANYKVPQWFADAKFGIFFHWGLYSVPAFGGPGNLGEWYSHNMYLTGTPEYAHHVKNYGPLSRFGYKDFAPLFRAEHWDPDAWVSLFKEAGARYVGPVAEHADGFAMWNSKVNPWNSARMGPKRDVVAEMERAVRRQGLKFMTSMHHHWLWGWYACEQRDADIYQPGNQGFYWPQSFVGVGKGAFDQDHPDPPPSRRFAEVWLRKVEEVVDGYHPDLLYFDSRLNIIPESYRERALAHFYNDAERHSRQVVLTYKGDDLPRGCAVFDTEAGQLAEKADFVWQTDDLLDWGSWAYRTEPEFKSPERVLRQLVDIVAKNGGLLLDVGPRPDGTIPEGVEARLRAIGAWLRVNGEAIYGTRPWRTFGEGPTRIKEGYYVADHSSDFGAADIRFTASAKALYVHVLGRPATAIHVNSVRRDSVLPGGPLTEIHALSTGKTVRWQWEGSGLRIEVPDQGLEDGVNVFRLS